jgi:hypothetical protein
MSDSFLRIENNGLIGKLIDLNIESLAKNNFLKTIKHIWNIQVL